jgi:hypothetical protein
MTTNGLLTLVGFFRVVIEVAIVAGVVWFASRRRRSHGGDGRDPRAHPGRDRRHFTASGSNALNPDRSKPSPPDHGLGRRAIGPESRTIEPQRSVP